MSILNHRSTVSATSIALICLLTPVFLLSGCGTLFGGDSLRTEITSVPTGAKVKLNGDLIGTTPTTVEIDPLEDNVVEARLEGYQDYKGKVDLTVNIPTVINILFPPAFLVDLLTGHWARSKDLKIIFLDMEGNPVPEADNW